MSVPDNRVWFLDHSAVAVKVGGRFFVFDYFLDSRLTPKDASLEDGIVNPVQICDEDVFVFFSHRHPDHFHRSVFEWRSVVSRIHFVVSDDIGSAPPDATVVGPNQVLPVEGLRVKTYLSTDEGVAFSVFDECRHLYFAGDLAFWNWEGEPESVYVNDVLSQIDNSMPMDIAFHVCDTRLEDRGYGGIGLFAQKFQPRRLIPIHCNGDYSLNKKVALELKARGYKGDFWPIQARGETWKL